MIKYEWRTELSADEADQLADLLDRAANYDAEPGYSTIDFADVQHAMAVGAASRHLVIWMLPYATAMAQREAPERIAGLLRMTDTAPGVAEATVVVDPRLRSIGIVTLLLERLGLDTSDPDGWLGTGAHTVTSWARGNHPATGRLSSRFLIPRTRRVWRLIRATPPHWERAASPVLEPSGTSAGGRRFVLREGGRVVGEAIVNRTPVDSEEYGACAVVERLDHSPSAPAGALRRLLDGISVVVHEAGLDAALIHVDSNDLTMVTAARLAGFHHDRTDVRYHIGEPS